MDDKALELHAIDDAFPDGPALLENPGIGDPGKWLGERREPLQAALRERGAILFRGFPVADALDFETFCSHLIERWMDYGDRASRRSAVHGQVFTSTDTPPAFTIALHNESSFTARWPHRIFFFCAEPPQSGGRTPLADVRRVYRSIDPQLRARFERDGVMYVRNFGPGVGMDWRDVFQVENPAELERFCEESMIALQWLDGMRVRTVQVRPASLRHPESGVPVWFNHALALHESSLDPVLRTALRRQHGEENLPHNTYFGNGDPIDDEQMMQLRRAYAGASVRFDWERGDVLMLDNLLCAHGREPYAGSRRVLAVLADPGSWQEQGLELALPLTHARTAQTLRNKPSAPDPGATSRRAELRDWFHAAVARELQLGKIDMSRAFSDLGGDSLSAVAVAEQAWERFSIEIDIDFLLQAESLEQVLKTLESAQV